MKQRTLNHVLLPCKMSSRRIPRKNLQRIGGQTLLELAIGRFESWFPDCTIHVATEDAEAADIAKSRGCQILPLSEDDITDRRDGSGLFNDWLSRRDSHERCMLHQLTSPFTFRSELNRAIDDPRPFCCAAWNGKLHFAQAGGTLSQSLPNSVFLTGNFYVSDGGYIPSQEESYSQFVPVSWLSAIDINTADDLELADRIAARMTLRDFDDVTKFHTGYRVPRVPAGAM